MYSLCVKGKMLRTLSVTKDHLIVSFELNNYSNVVFPNKEIPIGFAVNDDVELLQEFFTMVENNKDQLIELYIQFPRLGKVYDARLHAV